MDPRDFNEAILIPDDIIYKGTECFVKQASRLSPIRQRTPEKEMATLPLLAQLPSNKQRTRSQLELFIVDKS